MGRFLAEHFEPQAMREAAKRLFRDAVLRIEMETHSYCNRRCGYCPNVTGERLTPNRRMPDRLFERIIADLAEIGYAHLLVLNNYNEPLADRQILKRIAEARTALPRCTIRIYTNGDYLTPTYVEELATAGLSSMHVSVHMNPADVYSDVYAMNRIAEIAQRVGIRPNYKHLTPNRLLVAEFPHQPIEMEIRAINYWSEGESRGGLISGIKEEYQRRLPCHFPFFHFNIGFEGQIAPCCHLGSGRAEQESYLIGRLDDFGSIYEAFASSAAAGWRRHLAGFEAKASPCDHCSVGFMDGSKKTLDAYAKLYRDRIEPWLRRGDTSAAPG
jgi:hypothetical protein